MKPLILILLLIGVSLLFGIFQILKILIKKQIDDQIKKMIPLKLVRSQVGIKIKWL
ncbi:Hypothetical protein P9211_06411 [Prochlorococcus marinus str. MIT 9211]|uniref:Uncharacterized protein n=1 Tax=Prochlorococcus marinus (strain MIT 9211) TaxID=93059 RepID=A9B9R0_PROM4|nr:Hypothetical protein P9211_06411 [Prochlorococcus marinus str. MIT 9211]